MSRRRALRLLVGCGVVLVAYMGCARLGPSSRERRPETRTAGAVPLAGTFLVVDGRDHPHHGIVRLELPERATTPVFTAPSFSRVHQLATSSDGAFVVFSYTPPPGPEHGFMDRSGIYRLDLGAGGAVPRPLLEAERPQTFLLEAALAPDDRSLFYVRVEALETAAVPTYVTTLERLELATGRVQVVAPDGIWPRVSPDGSALAFIGVHPLTGRRGLFVCRPDGTGLRILVPIGRFFDIDTPVFAPDGASIYFSVAERARDVGLLGRLLGVAHAHTDHNVPSDWWRIPVAGGPPERVTERELIIVHGALDRAGRHLTFSTLSGMFALRLEDRAFLTVSDGTYFGTLGALPGRG